MQEKINEIIYRGVSKSSKMLKLKALFKDSGIYIFVDFDDTITDNSCLFYTRYKFFSRIKKYSIEKIYELLKKDFKLNQNIKNILSTLCYEKIIILSRNNHELLLLFLEDIKKHWLSVDCVIWCNDKFILTSSDKLDLIWNSIIVSDIFEYNKLKNYRNFICVDKYLFLRLIFLYFKKIFIYSLFVLKNV